MRNMEPFNKVHSIIIEQDADPVTFNFKRQMFKLTFDEKILAANARCIHYCRNKVRIIIKDDKLYRQYYNNVGDISQLQVLLTLQLKDTLLNSIYGQVGKHPRISKMMPEFRH